MAETTSVRTELMVSSCPWNVNKMAYTAKDPRPPPPTAFSVTKNWKEKRRRKRRRRRKCSSVDPCSRKGRGLNMTEGRREGKEDQLAFGALISHFWYSS